MPDDVKTESEEVALTQVSNSRNGVDRKRSINKMKSIFPERYPLHFKGRPIDTSHLADGLARKVE